MVRGLFFLLFISSAAFAIAVQVTAQVSPQKVQPKDLAVLTVNVSLEEAQRVKSPELPKGLDVRSQSQSEQVTYSVSSLSGSQRTINKRFKYQLVSPSKEGPWIINSIFVQVGKKTYKTKPLSIIVSKTAKKPKRPSSPLYQFFNINPSLHPFPDMEQPSKDSMKLKSFLPSRPVYLYERIPVKWFLYKSVNDDFSLNLTSRQLVQPEHFWTETLHAPQDLKFREVEKIDQKEYLKSLILSYVFFPLKTGKLAIDPLKIELQVINRNRFFSLDFNRFTLEALPLTIEVLPLPKENQGEFTGAVGSFIINGQDIKKEIQENDLLSYKVRFEGEGLVQNIKLPAWPKSSDFKVYDILESQNFSAKKSWKEFEILLSAKRAGLLRTPEFYWTTFDPELKSYVVQNIESQEVRVRGGTSLKTEKKSYLGTTDEDAVQPKQKYDISFIDSHISFYKKYIKWIWGSLYTLIIALIFFRNQLRFRLKPRRDLKKIYKKARWLCQNEQIQETGVLLLNLLDQVWLEISGIGGRELESLLEKCPPSIRHDFGVQIQNLVKNLEDLSFAPSNNMEYQKKWSCEKVEKQIQDCEKLIQRLLKYTR